MDFLNTLDWTFVSAILISLGVGAVIGLERQRHFESESEHREIIGVRTFSLAALLGTISTFASETIPGIQWLTGGGYFILVIAYLFFQFRKRDTVPGITTELAALLVFVLGAMVPNRPVLAAALGVIIAIILSLKDFTHSLVEKLSEVEVSATLQFLLVTVVMLPLLPDQSIDPWGIYNPRELWFLVVLISGISFLGYFAIRFLGRRRGILLTGALGGLASSTALTLAMAQRVRRADDGRSLRLAAALAIILANGIMTIRVTVEVAAVNTDLLRDMLIPIGAMAASVVAVAAVFWWKLPDQNADEDGEDEHSDELEDGADEQEEEDDLDVTNPFRLGPALKFGALFVLIIGGVHLARTYFGSSGTYAAAAISGLADADAVSIAVARMADAGDTTHTTAVRAIIIAMVSNSLVKAGLAAFLGSYRLGLWVALGLLPMIVAGVASTWLFL